MKFIHGAHHFESCLATWPHSSLRQCSEIGFDIKELQSKLKTNLLCGISKLGKTFNVFVLVSGRDKQNYMVSVTYLPSRLTT